MSFFLSQFGIQPVFFVEPAHGTVLDLPAIDVDDGDESYNSDSSDSSEGSENLSPNVGKVAHPNWPKLRQPLALNTDISDIATDENVKSSVIISADVIGFDMPNHRLNATSSLHYHGIFFTKTSVSIPQEIELFLPTADMEKFSVYQRSPYKLVAMIECDFQVKMETKPTDQDEDGITLAPGVHLYTGPTKFYIFLELKEI